MANSILTLPNSVDFGTLSAGSAASGYPVTNLQIREPAIVWRSAADILLATSPLGYPGSRWLQYVPTASVVDTSVLVVGLVNDASRPVIGGPSRRWRVRAYSGSFGGQSNLAGVVRPAPGTPSPTTNLGGAQSASVWLTPPASWLTATVKTSNTQAVWTFANTQTDQGALPLKAGASLQTFNVYCRKSGASGTNPTLSIDLYYGGALVANLVSGVSITSTSGQLVQVQWNASLLSVLNGQTVGIRCTGTAGTANTVEYAAVEWQAEHNGYLADSGDLSIAYPAFAAQQTQRIFNLFYVLPTAITISGVGASVLVDQWDATSSPGYAQQGRLIVANGIQPTINMDYNWSLVWVPTSVITRSVGGQISSDVRPPYRLGEFAFKSLRENEAWDQLFSELQGYVGITGDFCWIPDPANLGQYYNWNVYCRFQELSPTTNPIFIRYAQSHKVEEWL